MTNTTETANRGNAGLGRPKGSPNKISAEVKGIAQSYGLVCVQRLAELAGVVKGEDGAPIGKAQSEKVQLAAIALLLDRAYGKPATILANDDEGPLIGQREIMFQFVDRPPPETRDEWLARKKRETSGAAHQR